MALYKMRGLAVSDNDYVFWTDSEPDLDGSNAPEAVVTDSITILSVNGGVELPSARTTTESDHEIVMLLNESSAPFANSGNTSSSDWTIANGTVTPNQDGIIDKSVLFDGSSSSRVSAPATSDLTGWTEGTGMAWFKSTISDQGTWGLIFVKEHGSWPNVTFGIGLGGTASLTYRINDTQVDITFRRENNVWYHVALVASSTERTTYINGEVVDTRSGQTISWIAGDNTTPWSLGGSSQTTGRHFTGNIEDFRFISRALSQSEIQDIVARGKVNYWNEFLASPL